LTGIQIDDFSYRFEMKLFSKMALSTSCFKATCPRYVRFMLHQKLAANKWIQKYHQTYNKYLNKETAKSNQNPMRVPIKYEHIRETDSFYELPQAGFSLLPDYARRILNPRTTKVRITRETKSGAMLAKIVKAKLSNLEIHFPSQELDVRISVNLEIQYTGDIQDLEEAREDGRRQPSRIKDRMCYHHQFCEVDLTQVTKAEDGMASKAQSKTHEVEIELDAEAVRREGKALQMNGPSRYEELVTTFMNHVRELVRTQLEPS
jgi:polynucleotide 5'-triphosphatase